MQPVTTDISERMDWREKTSLAMVGVGVLSLIIAAFGAGSAFPEVFAVLGLGLTSAGAVWYYLKTYRSKPEGIYNNDAVRRSTTARGVVGWVLGIVMTGFYVLLYWYPSTLEHLIRTTDGLSWLIRGREADQWFLYGTFYTLAVLVMGVRMLVRHRDSRYHIIRTISVMFFQLGFAFVLPGLLLMLNQPEFYFHYFWPLQYSYLWPSGVDWITRPGALGVFMIFWGGMLSFVATPILTYFYGKRWYCSWVCGCGGLAETAGDPWRHLSDKSLSAWKFERWLIHSVLVVVTVGTILLWVNSWSGGSILGGISSGFSRWYGFFIGSIFAGVIGVGFYPLMGSRVWCRFGCPMAAYLGIIQRFYSRFRITTNGGQCISCGNCSKYCEMGIDVRWYAQRGQNIVRASCVGCGMCATVCPRGVLRLENGPLEKRLDNPSMAVGRDEVGVISDTGANRTSVVSL